MTAPANSIEFIEQAVRDIFVALMLDGWDAVDIRIMADDAADTAISVFRRDYASQEVPK